MRTSVKITGGLALLTMGYVVGASQILSPGVLLAQGKSKTKAAADAQAAAQPLSDETKTKIKAAADALKAAMEALQSEGRYDSAIKGVNAFAVLSGGGNSLEDLKRGVGGVDPETFAALYANLATDQVVVDLGRDAEGRMTYKNRVVRMYPVSVIRAAYARRADITGEDLLPATEEPSKSKPKKTEPTEDESAEEAK
jgi:hypothetical protein